MRSYFRVMLGKASAYARECFQEGFAGVDFDVQQDLTDRFPADWRTFNKEFAPIYLAANPGKNKISAGLACGSLWMLGRGIREGDVIFSPSGAGDYRLGEVIGPYFYRPGSHLPHRRPVRWGQDTVRDEASEELRRAGSAGTISNISKHAEEIERLLSRGVAQPIISPDPTIEDPMEFVMEEHLEDFLVKNWAQTELGRRYDIFEEDGEKVGRQFQTDTGPMDILAVGKDKKELLVIELKKGRASDVVVGQILRYMGYVAQELAEANQRVKGVIIALKDDVKMRRALAVAQGIEFYRYKISFKLAKD